MKKLVTLLAAAGMVAASSAPANAVDVKVDGSWRLSFKAGETGFTGANQEQIKQRLRLGVTAVASENLSGYFQFQIGKDDWGTTTNTHGNHTADSMNKGGSHDYNQITLRQSYIDWTVPGTAAKVRMGRFALGLPSDAMGYGNLAFSSDWGNKEGVAVSAPVTDWLGLTAMWTRIGVEANDNMYNTDMALNDDLFAAVADMKFDGVKASVYAAYATLDGSTSGIGTKLGDGTKGTNFKVEKGDAYWVGFTSTLTAFDPFTLALSAAYGSFEADDNTGDTDGWHVQAMASYKLGFGTPFIGAWYMSGMDDDNEGLMPSIGGYFTPTRTYHDSAKGLCGAQQFGIPSGNWGVQAGIDGVSFLSGLSHEFKVTYMEGTNDKAANIKGINGEWALTEEDSLVEFDLVNSYKIYKNLTAHLELSYIISDFDKTTKSTLTEDDWRAELTFQYKF